MEIKKPYLLFLGDAQDPLAAKVAQGIKQWHPEYCAGQFRMEDCKADCGLTDMDIAQAKNLAFALGIVMSRMHGDLEKFVKENASGASDDIIKVEIGSGGEWK